MERSLVSSGNTKLTNQGKELYTKYMYQKGKDFLGAAILLKQNGCYTHAYIHLICLSIELIFKSLLLKKDFDRFHPKLLKKNIGHDLVKLVNDWKKEINYNKIRVKFLDEIKTLNGYYINQGLRYASLVDFFIQPESIPLIETFKQLRQTIQKTDELYIKNT